MICSRVNNDKLGSEGVITNITTSTIIAMTIMKTKARPRINMNLLFSHIYYILYISRIFLLGSGTSNSIISSSILKIFLQQLKHQFIFGMQINKNKIMNQSVVNNQKTPSLQRVSCGRYNVSFSTTRDPSRKFVAITKSNATKRSTSLMRQTVQSQISPKQTNTMNKTYSKYSYFPSNIKKFQSCSQIQKIEVPPIKWIGTKSKDSIDSIEQYQIKNNCFPKRKKKTGNQVIINMIYKYDRYYGKQPLTQFKSVDKSQIEKSIKNNHVRQLLEKQKKYPAQANWFRRRYKQKQ